MERWSLMDVRRVPVAKISKTHKRLLTCAEQLINAQPLIFVDDPTRNVDASQARICMRTLKYLAYKGHTVVAVISNPSINMMKYFNKLYVLTEGRLIYSGSPMEMKSSLGAHGFVCPAELPITEYMLQVSAKMHGGLRALAETEAIKAREAIEAKSSEAGPSDAPVVTVDPGFKEEGADGNEEAKPSSRRKGSMANIFEGRVEVDSRDHLSLIFNRFIFYTYRSSHAIHEQRYSLYSKRIYFMARIFSEIVYELMFSLAAGIFNYYLSHQLREESRIFFFLCFSFQVCVLSQALGMLIGSCFDYEIGCMVSATVFAHALLFLGFFFPAKDLAVHAVWLPYTSYLFYAFNGAMTAVFGWKRTLRCPEGSPRSCPFSSGDQVLARYWIDENLLYANVVALPVLTLALWAAAYCVLSFRIKWRF
ncbi:ABC transporter, putative [Ixodes scapularis]|uniref:ABC transporter, putative n=1 Tax=Ixodes scapularis TaxID=6945 RepID=B7PMR6_IXOSC|nr:ABC transporter, putative [Ixodes scapularis]|eukprot:XP_002435064.1 ABC transporter, putative [Ixodes scapularis]